MKVGAFDLAAGRSPPIGTPFAYPALTQSLFCKTFGANPEPPNKRTLIRTPLVPKVSLRCMAARSPRGVFSSAHTPPSPEVANWSIDRPWVFTPLMRACGVASSKAMTSEKVGLCMRRGGTVGITGHRRHQTCTGCSRACPASPARSRTPRGYSCRAASARDLRRPVSIAEFRGRRIVVATAPGAFPMRP